MKIITMSLVALWLIATKPLQATDEPVTTNPPAAEMTAGTDFTKPGDFDARDSVGEWNLVQWHCSAYPGGTHSHAHHGYSHSYRIAYYTALRSCQRFHRFCHVHCHRH